MVNGRLYPRSFCALDARVYISGVNLSFALCTPAAQHLFMCQKIDIVGIRYMVQGDPCSTRGCNRETRSYAVGYLVTRMVTGRG